jgi:GNAT superfamily N-acetyltransferase
VTSPFAIRAANREDARAIAEVHLESRRVAMPWLPVLHSLDDAVAYFGDHVLANEQVWVAEADGEVVGFIALDGGHVDHLYVFSAYQGRGIGDALIGLAKRNRSSGLTLWTFQRNSRARHFYEKRGFVAVEFTDGAGNEEKEPDVLYNWMGGAS